MGWRVGFGTVDITPRHGTVVRGMYGGGPSPIAATWIPMTARAAVVEDGLSRCVVIALDLLTITRYTADRVRRLVAERCGVAADHVLVNCSHSHSTVRTFSAWEAEEPNHEFLASLEAWVVEAAGAALASVEPVELVAGTTSTTGLAFNRRPVYRGEEVGTHGPMWVPDFERLEGPSDGELQVILARRPDGTVAGGMVNFACHPHMMIAEPVFSADFAGEFVNRLGARLGGTFLFLQGASGNISWHDMSRPYPEVDPVVGPWGLPQVGGWNPAELLPRHADALVAASEDAIARAIPVHGAIRIGAREVELAQRRPTPEQLELAFWYLAQDPDTVDHDDYNRRMTGHRYTFYDTGVLERGYAHQIIGLNGAQRLTAPAPAVDRPEVGVIALGNVALVGYPAEMFTEFGVATKAASPFDLTLVCGLTNGWYSYVPTVEAFGRGGYETRLSGGSRLEVGAGDKLTAAAIELLEVAAG